MKNKLENILLGLLWILASALGACFWFNTQYGFNIFSGTHWRHLAYMQATQNPIKTSFYMSITFTIIIVIGGLYILIRPHFRKIKMAPTPSDTTVPQPVTTTPTTHTDEMALARPKRLIKTGTTAPTPSSASTTQYHAAPIVTPIATQTPSSAPQAADNPELIEIFQDAGYTTKPAPRISGLQTSLMAIGSGETVWLGATDIETSTLQSAIEVMNQLFMETLEDIPITVHGFVINAADAAAPKASDILTFASIDDLRTFISANPNPPIAEQDIENFEAFSNYISTVIDYLRKI